MQLDPEDLSGPDYVLLERLDHKNMVPFVRTYLQKRTSPVIAYYLFNLLIFVGIVFLITKSHVLKQISFGEGLGYLVPGFGLFFLLIPLHEYIHGLAYKWQGAVHTSYDMNLRKFYFLAIADKFVADRAEFRIVALAPFVVISSALIALLFFVAQPYVFTVLGALFLHTSACSGDFALLSFYAFHRSRTILTYDDKANGISYFYEKTN